MSDVLGWFNPTRWIVLTLMSAGLVAGYFGWEYHQRSIGRAEGRAEIQAKWDTDKATRILELDQANKRAHTKELELQREKDEAVNAAQRQTQLARRDAAVARAAADGVFSDLAAARAELANKSEQTRAKYEAALDAVFTDCARRYSEMAETAQGHAIDSLMYQRGWPK